MSRTNRDKQRWQNKHKQWRDDYEKVEYDRVITYKRGNAANGWRYIDLPPEEHYVVKGAYSVQKPGLRPKKRRDRKEWTWMKAPGSFYHEYVQVPYRAKEQQWERNVVKAMDSVLKGGVYANPVREMVMLSGNLEELFMELEFEGTAEEPVAKNLAEALEGNISGYKQNLYYW